MDRAPRLIRRNPARSDRRGGTAASRVELQFVTSRRGATAEGRRPPLASSWNSSQLGAERPHRGLHPGHFAGQTWLSLANVGVMASTTVNTHEAKSRLSQLIRQVEAGDEVIVARNGHPVAKLIAWPPARPARRAGLWSGKVEIHGDVVGSDDDVIALFDESTGAPEPA